MKLALLVGGIILAGSAQAQFQTGNDLVNDMRSQSAVDRMFAAGYITGVADLGNGVSHCIPKGVTVGQLVDLSNKFLTNAPEIRNVAGDVILLELFRKTWPCATKGRSES